MSMNFCQSKCYTLRQNFDCEKVSQHVEVYHADSSRGPIRWQQMDGYGKFHFLPFITLAPEWTGTFLFNLIRQNVELFFFQHQRFCSDAREQEPDVLWVGDSIIQNLVNSGIWERIFCQMHSLNFGIGGDRTEHLLWRLQNGELEGLAPKVMTDNFFTLGQTWPVTREGTGNRIQ